MINEFTVVFEQDEDWYIAYCLELPGANSQGATMAEARKNVAEAIARKLAARQEKSRRDLAPYLTSEAVEEVLALEYPPEKGRIKLAPEAAQEVVVVECI